MGRVLKLVRVTADGSTTFEAYAQNGSKKRAVAVNANGITVLSR